MLVDREDLKPYECDGLSAYRATPLVATIPADESEVAAILAVARETRTPVVARGSGTGLSGGALPLADGILLSLAKFNRIVAVDALARTAKVQPGVTNLRISQHVAPLGLYYAPDPSSQIACSIGGNVAENSGGVHCLKYGLTVHNVMRVRAITIDGDLIELGGEALDAPGYDLLALVIGSEGMLAVTLEVTVKLLAKPELAQVVMASFRDVESAGEAVANVIGAGIVPAGPRDDGPARHAGGRGFRARRLRPRGARRSCSPNRTARARKSRTRPRRLIEILRGSGATDISCSASEAERLRFWSGRKAAFPAVGRISPDYYCIDGSIPRSALARVLKRIEELSAQYALRCANVFHAGDGNLHPLILYDANVPGELEKTERFAADILELCIECGGTITGEHGVGIEKINQMCIQFRPAELAQFHAVKAAFDPEGLLNPGKGVPALARCAEYGAMRVKGGALPHPELPRF